MTVRSVLNSVRRSFEVSGAFFRLGLQQELSYPIGFVTGQLGTLVPVIIFYFVAQLVDRPEYYGFVLVGLVASKFMEVGIRGFGMEMDLAINRGWLEMYLVAPVRWRMLPISMVQWRALLGIANGLLMAVIGIVLGAQIRTDQLGAALAIVAMGLIAALAIGTLSASMKVLSKQGDPILFVYTFAVQIFSGVYFPVESLPEAIRWISWLLPHTYAIIALRGALLPSAEGAVPVITPETALLALTLFSVVMFPLAIWLFGRALEYGRKLGVLSGY